MKESLSINNPELSQQWHPTKNGELTPDDVMSGSDVKVWWQCEKGHEWEATIRNRINGTGCPYCSNKRVCIDNCLQTVNPEVAKQWHPTKNGALSPNDVMSGSNRKAWWLCEKGHEWEETIGVRSNGSGCPFCSGRRASADNCLQTLNPTLAAQWHPTENGGLTPNDVTTGSGRKVWWQCDKGHEWEAVIHSRNNGVGCPYCSGYRVCIDNCLQTVNPDLAKQWHPTKNGDLTPHNYYAGSSKKVWWQCEKGHEWEVSAHSRSKGSGCPVCSGRKAHIDDCLQVFNPELSKQWHPTKNKELMPYDVKLNSGKKVWWLCDKGHEWEATINSRSSGVGCPFCSGKRACADNSLQTLFPEVAKQWHPTKNKNKTPNDVTAGSSKKAWWLCEKGHEWDAVIHNRAKGIGCPICTQESSTSFPEQVLFYYIKNYYSDTINRYKLNSVVEIDIFIPSLKIGIEYDGIYFHKDKQESEAKKEKLLSNNGICLLRVRETEKNALKCYRKDNVIYCNRQPTDIHLNEITKLCFDFISENMTKNPCDIDIDVARDRANIYELYIEGEKERSLVVVFPDLAKEWHPIKNGKIRPEFVNAQSNKKFWWQCEKGHEWEASVNNRRGGDVGCPFCAGKRVCADNCLQTVNPDLAKQWHPTKNGTLTPNDVVAGSNKKVWWLCERGHEWQRSVAYRIKSSGCTLCNSLQVLNPELAKQWHPTKNGNLTPLDLASGSNKKVWWQCVKGHEWEASVGNRASGRNCPYCAGQYVCDDNSLQTLNPELAKQWHPNKNGDLSPNDVMPYSNKKVWWQCGNGHEWEATVNNRSNGKGCPICAEQKRIDTKARNSLKNGNDLETQNPVLAKEWHPIKNGDLTPNGITPYSNKKVWWQCEKGHEWEASIDSRNRGSGCPFCSGKLR